MHRRLEWDKVTGNHLLARTRLEDAQRRFEEEMKELKPGEVSPGVSEVMIRKGPRAKYKKALINTPRLNAACVTFLNGKSAWIQGFIETNEDPTVPFLWITLGDKL